MYNIIYVYYIDIHTCAYIYIYIHIYIYTCVYIHIHIYIYIEREMCIYTYIHLYTHMCIYIYIYIHMYTYVCGSGTSGPRPWSRGLRRSGSFHYIKYSCYDIPITYLLYAHYVFIMYFIK